MAPWSCFCLCLLTVWSWPLMCSSFKILSPDSPPFQVRQQNRECVLSQLYCFKNNLCNVALTTLQSPGPGKGSAMGAALLLQRATYTVPSQDSYQAACSQLPTTPFQGFSCPLLDSGPLHRHKHEELSCRRVLGNPNTRSKGRQISEFKASMIYIASSRAARTT